MSAKLSISLLTVAAATAALVPLGREQVHAGTLVGSVLQDTDDDFLPDCVEWAVLSSATDPDTDDDGVGDFVEVVQRGTPRYAGNTVPADHEMRIVVTGPAPGSGDSLAWLHLLVRILEPDTPLQSFQAWVETPLLPGCSFPFDILALGSPVLRVRDAGGQGQWLSLSVPLASVSLLHSFLPCSVQIEATLGGRYIRSGVKLFDVMGSIATLVAFDPDRFAVQTISAQASSGMLANRVCLLDLAEVGSGPGGTVYEVADASCEDCNELECAVTCPSSIGWLITIPGGISTIGGGQ